MQPEIRTVVTKAWPWRALPFRGLCPKRTGRREHASSRQSQEYATTYLKIRRVTRPDGVTPRTAHPPSLLHRVLPPMSSGGPPDHFPNLTRFFRVRAVYYPQPKLHFIGVADHRNLGWCGNPLTKFPILVRGVAPPTKFSQIALGAGRPAKIGERGTNK